MDSAPVHGLKKQKPYRLMKIGKASECATFFNLSRPKKSQKALVLVWV